VQGFHNRIAIINAVLRDHTHNAIAKRVPVLRAYCNTTKIVETWMAIAIKVSVIPGSGRTVSCSLSVAHFLRKRLIRFGWFTEALWSVLGLVPAVLAFSGVFICCPA